MVDKGKMDSARRVLELAKGLGEVVSVYAREQAADPASLSLALMMIGYMMVRASKDTEVERRYWEAARLAKELFELVDPGQLEQLQQPPKPVPSRPLSKRRVSSRPVGATRTISTTNPDDVRALASAFRERLFGGGDSSDDD